MPGSVAFANIGHTDCGELSWTDELGCKTEQRLSADPGPMISMDPISNRRSSTVTAGFCTFAIRMTSFHSCRKAQG